MPRKRNDNLDPTAIFQKTLRAALDHLHDPIWLGEHSPLAAVYFLGDRAGDGTAADRGRALITLFHKAMNQLWDGPLPPTGKALLDAVEEMRRERGNSGDEYDYLLLELRYFRRHFTRGTYPAQVSDIPVFLNVSTTRFFVHLDRAIDRLGEALLRPALRPVLRPERPPAPEHLIGRARELARLRGELAAGRSVALSGAAGVGKTTLAAAAVALHSPDLVFWYTFLPNFNDNLPSLLFALGYFLHNLGRSTLWRQLLADPRQIPEPEQVLGMVRADLAGLPAAPLFCFDEVDLLHTSDGDTRSATHARLLAFLESLSLATPVLLVGQRSYIDTPAHIALEPLDASDTAALLAAAGLNISRRQATLVDEVTDGLPRLIELVIALARDGDNLDEIVRLHLRADARPLFNRLWRRLDQPERELLIALSVFRRPAPGDAWPNHAAAERSLRDRHLLQPGNAEGGLLLLQFFRRLVYEELRGEQREAAHAQAATLRAARGEFTAAAFHWVHAGEPEAAVAVWFPNRALEVEHGQAGAALNVFGELSARRLPHRTAGQLKVIQNQLYLLTGHSQQVVENMAGFEWHIDDAPAAVAHFQTGDALRMLGQEERALDEYEQVINEITNRVAMAAESLNHRSVLFVRNGDMPAAHGAALRAHLFAHMIDGYLAMHTGRFAEAEVHFADALRFVEQSTGGDPLAIRIYRSLGYIAGSRGTLEAAERYYQLAIDYYKRIGNTTELENTRADLAGIYLNSRQFERYIPMAELSLRFFEQIGHQPRVANLASNLAEAYLETNRLDEAAAYANRVLQMEIPRQRPYALYTLGLIHQRQGRPDYAAAAFADGIRTAQISQSRFIEAYLHRLDGRLRLEQGDAPGGRVALQTALTLFTEMGIEHEADATRTELDAAGD